MGHDPNCSLRSRPHVKWNDQSFDDWELSLIEILKITARMREKLRRLAVERDSARTEIPGGCSTDMLCEFSGQVGPSEFLLTGCIRFQQAESNRARATQIQWHVQEAVYHLCRGNRIG